MCSQCGFFGTEPPNIQLSANEFTKRSGAAAASIARSVASTHVRPPHRECRLGRTTISTLRPALEEGVNLGKNATPRGVPLPAAGEKLIVVGVHVSNVSAHGQSNRVRIEPLRIGNSAHAPGVFETSMFGYGYCIELWAPGIDVANVLSKLRTIADVDGCVPLGSALASARASLTVGETFLLGTSQRGLLHQSALTLVSIARATESDQYRLECGILAGSSSECSVAAWQEDEMCEVSARHAEGALLFKAEPASPCEFLATLGAGRVAQNLEYNDVVRVRAGRFGSHDNSKIRRRWWRPNALSYAAGEHNKCD